MDYLISTYPSFYSNLARESGKRNGFFSPLSWKGIMSRFHLVACHVLWRELCHHAALSAHTFTFDFLKQGLHNTPDLLREALQKAVDSAPEEAEAVLVGYGLCCNGIEGIVARGRPLVFMRGHDCITFLLGSRDRYREYVERRPGTYWYSAGWIETGFTPGPETADRTLRSYIEKYGEDNAQYLMEMEQGWLRKYSHAVFVEQAFLKTPVYREYTERCARWLGWNCDVLEGNPGLLADFVEGNWSDEDYLVVEPGGVVAASHDERVIVNKEA